MSSVVVFTLYSCRLFFCDLVVWRQEIWETVWELNFVGITQFHPNLNGTDVNNIVFWSSQKIVIVIVWMQKKKTPLWNLGRFGKRRKLGVAEEEKGPYRHLVERLINCETLKNEWNVKYKIWNEAKIWGGTKVEECICMLLGHYWEPQKTKTISSCHAKTNATASEIIHLVEYIIMLSQDFLKVFLRKFEYS